MTIKGPIIVTGAGGFVGAAAVRALVAAGHQVLAGFHSIPKSTMPKGITAIRLDVMDAGSLAEAFAGAGAVVHCAVGPPRDTSVIIEGTRNAVTAARAAGVGQFIHLSSVAVYGAAQGHLHEGDVQGTPADAYGAAKLQSEAICAAQAGDMACAILRPSLIYGPNGAQWTTLYLDRLKTGRWPALGGAGEGKCNLIHVDDLVGFIAHIIGSQAPVSGTFNVNGADIPSWNGYLEMLARAVGATPGPVKPMPGVGLLTLRKIAKAGSMILAKSGVNLRGLQRFVELTPSADEVVRFASTTDYAIDAMLATGFVPRISVAQGVAGIAQWEKAGRPSEALRM